MGPLRIKSRRSTSLLEKDLSFYRQANLLGQPKGADAAWSDLNRTREGVPLRRALPTCAPLTRPPTQFTGKGAKGDGGRRTTENRRQTPVENERDTKEIRETNDKGRTTKRLSFGAQRATQTRFLCTTAAPATSHGDPPHEGTTAPASPTEAPASRLQQQ